MARNIINGFQNTRIELPFFFKLLHEPAAHAFVFILILSVLYVVSRAHYSVFISLQRKIFSAPVLYPSRYFCSSIFTLCFSQNFSITSSFSALNTEQVIYTSGLPV